mgnify:CR=1 FL=1
MVKKYRYVVNEETTECITLFESLKYIRGHSTTTWTEFYPPPLEWTIVDIFTWYLPFVTWLNVDSLLTPSSSCPRSFWMTPNSRLLEASFGAKLCYRNSISLPFHFYEPDNLRLEWKEMFNYFNCDWKDWYNLLNFF